MLGRAQRSCSRRLGTGAWKEGRLVSGGSLLFGFCWDPRLPRMTAGLGLEGYSGSQEPESLKYEGCGQGRW